MDFLKENSKISTGWTRGHIWERQQCWHNCPRRWGSVNSSYFSVFTIITVAGNHQESLWNRYRPGHYGGTWHRQWQTLINDNCNTAFWKRKRKNYILDLKKIMTGPSTNNGTMISYSEGTMVQHDTGPGTAQSKTMSEIGNHQLLGFMIDSVGIYHCFWSYQGTMVINSKSSSDDQSPLDENTLVTNYDTMVFNQGTMVVNESYDIGLKTIAA